MVFEVHFMVHT